MNKPSTARRILTTDLPVFIIVLFALGPFAWMVLTSLTPTDVLNATGVSASPADWSLDNYARLLRQTTFLDNMLDSLIIAVGTVVLGLAVAVTAAYSFSRFRFAGRRLLMLQFLLINMFPVVLLILPLFVLMRKAGILDTHFGLILANATVAIPFAVWMLTSYIGAIPRSLDEAAMIDGCSGFKLFVRVIFPLLRPVTITVIVTTSIIIYNDFVNPLYFLPGSENATVQLTLYNFQGQFNTQWNLLFTDVLLITIPPLVMFMLFNRKIVSGLTAGAIKA
jgi:multiple sugar transport system permease protein